MASNGKRMVKEDLINYLEKVKTNYPDPSDIGGGSSTGTYVYSLHIYTTTFDTDACFTGISTYNNTAVLDAIIEKYENEYRPGQAYIELYNGFDPSELNSELTNDELTALYTMLQNSMKNPNDQVIINSSSADGNLIINVTQADGAGFSGSIISFSDSSSSLSDFEFSMNNSDYTGFASTLTTDDSVYLTIYKVA